MQKKCLVEKFGGHSQRCQGQKVLLEELGWKGCHVTEGLVGRVGMERLSCDKLIGDRSG